MATNYIPVSSYATVKVFSPSQVLDVQMIGFYTIPTGIYCEYGVPHDAFVHAGGSAADQPEIDTLAQDIENAIEGAGVTGGTFVQEVDPSSGLLTDFVQYDLAYKSPITGRGPFTTYVNVPVSAFLGASPGIGGLLLNTAQYPAPFETVAEAYASLVAMAGG
jgi:hypothetical protein